MLHVSFIVVHLCLFHVRVKQRASEEEPAPFHEEIAFTNTFTLIVEPESASLHTLSLHPLLVGVMEIVFFNREVLENAHLNIK